MFENWPLHIRTLYVTIRNRSPFRFSRVQISISLTVARIYIRDVNYLNNRYILKERKRHERETGWRPIEDGSGLDTGQLRVQMNADEARVQDRRRDERRLVLHARRARCYRPCGDESARSWPADEREVALQKTLLCEGLVSDQGVVLASVTTGGSEVLAEFHSRIGEVPRMGIIDRNGGQASDGMPTQVSQVATPADLTGIGIEVARWFTRFEQDDATAGVRFGVDSLSSMLMYADLARVFRFVHVLTNRVRQADGLSLFGFNPGSRDEKTVNTQLFDGQLVVHHEDDPSLILRNE